MNLGIILIFAAVLPTPAPSPAPAGDPCGGQQTNLLAALNRPTIGFSACSVKRGENVSEFGYLSGALTDGSRVISYPQGFIRFGAARDLEIDFVGPGYAIAGSQRGSLDSGFGAKYEWWHDASRVFATDFLYTVPSGSRAFTAGAPVAALNVDYSAPLTPNVGFGTTLGLQSAFSSSLAGRSARFFSLVPSVVLTTQTNSRTQWYAEAFGQAPLRPDGGALYGNDGGVQYLLAPWLEVDLEATRTVTDLTRAYSYGIGFGIRI